MKISGITFALALELGPVGENKVVGYSLLKTCPPSRGPGVYVVIQDRKTIVYIGSYQTGVIQRWGYSRKTDVYHFKHDLIRDMLPHHRLRVFAQEEKEIKEQIGQIDNAWVNAHGIESTLISIHKPVWNKRGNSKWAQSIVQTLEQK